MVRYKQGKITFTPAVGGRFLIKAKYNGEPGWIDEGGRHPSLLSPHKRFLKPRRTRTIQTL